MEQQASIWKKVLSRLLILLLLSGGGLYAYKIIDHRMKHEETENAYLEGDIVAVSPKIQGYIAEVRVKENQHVQVGDTLFVLDNRDFVLRVRQAEAALEQAKANVQVVSANVGAAEANIGTANATYQTSTTGVATAESLVRTAEANVEVAEARLWRANQDYQRYSTLVAQRAVTQQMFDVSKAEKEAAEAAVLAARGQVETARRQVETARKQSNVGQSQMSAVETQAKASRQNIGLAKTAIAQRKLDVETARLNLSYTILLASSSGYIAKKTAQVGQLVNPGSPLCNIVSDSALWVNANFKETQVGNMKVGQPVEIKVDAYPDKVFGGKIESIAPATGAKFSLLPPDNSSGNFVKVVQRVPVRIALDKTDTDRTNASLRPGMSVQISIAKEIKGQ